MPFKASAFRLDLLTVTVGCSRLRVGSTSRAGGGIEEVRYGVYKRETCQRSSISYSSTDKNVQAPARDEQALPIITPSDIARAGGRDDARERPGSQDRRRSLDIHCSPAFGLL